MSERDLNITVEALIQQEGLPASYAETVATTILPLVEHILELRRSHQRTLVVGVHGAQGTGKSTLTLFLQELLSLHRGCRAASFSLDDIYLTRAERQQLAEQVHPLFITRGVPGTHDVGLGQQVIDRLKLAGPDDRTPIPSFDKATDDRVPADRWPVFQGAADVILVEGWCLGARPEAPQALAEPINRLEHEEDRQGVWRGYVNDCLAGSYAPFFDQMDSLIMLKAPSMASVLEWRTLQEHKLAAKSASAPNKGGQQGAASSLRIMSDDEVARFIMHYERVTRACLAEMPDRADVLVQVAEDHALGLPMFRAG